MMELSLEEMRALKLNAVVMAWLAQRADTAAHELDVARCPLCSSKPRCSRAKSELDRALLRQLGVGGWIAERQNVTATGTDRRRKNVSRVRARTARLQARLPRAVSTRTAPLRLIEELALAHAYGCYKRPLTRFAKTDVLILDDWGLAPLGDQQRRDVVELLDDRHGSRSTVVTSQLPIEWHDHTSATQPIADAVLDRLVHTDGSASFDM